MMDSIVVVRSRQQAFALNNYLLSRGIRISIASTPVGLGKGCSLSIWFFSKDILAVKTAIRTLNIPIIGIYQKDELNGWHKALF